MGFPSRTRVVALSVFGALACATASATTLSATLLDPKDAPAFVSACSIDNDSSGVFTPAIVVTDRKPSAVTSADVAIDFFDAQNRMLGEVVVSPPYGPQGLPFGSIDRVGCRIKRAQFLDGSVYEVKDRSTTANALAPIAGAILGIGAAAVLIGSNKGGGSKSSGTSAASPTPNPAASSTPVPVASVIPLAKPKKR
jgi:hypothetical protein